MPPNAHSASVSYEASCFPLTLSHTGMGTDPAAMPLSSTSCSSGAYHAGAVIDLTATPDPGWIVVGWAGTDLDTSQETLNRTIMPPASHTVTVNYLDGSRVTVFVDGFESGNTAAWSSSTP